MWFGSFFRKRHPFLWYPYSRKPPPPNQTLLFITYTTRWQVCGAVLHSHGWACFLYLLPHGSIPPKNPPSACFSLL